MSDVAVETAEKKPVEPAQSEQPKTSKDEGDGYGAAFKSLQAEKARLEGELASLTKKLGDRDKELGEFKARVDGYEKRAAEAKTVAAIKAALPDVSEVDIRGRLLLLSDEGKCDRFSADADETAKVVLEHFKANTISHASPTRPAGAMGGGPNGAPMQPGQRHQSKLLI